MKKKGFTLIELLAVIIILAVIALIATPVVLNVVDNARKQANKNSVYGLLDSAKLYYLEGELDTNKKGIDGNTNLINKISISGNRPSSGNVYINESGETALSVVYDKVCYKKAFHESEITETTNIEECETKINDSTIPEISMTVTTKTDNAKVILTCNDFESDIIKYEYKINEEEWIESENNTYIFTNLTSKTEYEIKGRCTNGVNLVNETSEIISTKEIENPTITQLSQTPSSGTWTQERVIRITYYNTNIENPKYYYSLDGSEWIEVSSKTYDVTFTSNGYLYAKTVDSTGNTANASTYAIINIDTSVPSTSITVDDVKTDRVTVTATCSDSESGIAKYEFSKDDGTTWIDNGTINSYTFTELSQGTNHTYKVRCTNGSGLTNEASGMETTSSISNPTIAQSSQMPSSGTYAQSRTIRITYYDTNIENPKYYYSLDGSEWIEVSSATYDVTFTSNGYLYAKTMDEKGNTANASTYTVTNIDTESASLTLSKDTYYEGFDGWDCSGILDDILTFSESGECWSGYYNVNNEPWHMTFDGYTTSSASEHNIQYGSAGPGNGGIYVETEYYDENYNVTTSSNGYAANGHAPQLPLNTWSNDFYWDGWEGYGTKYLKIGFSTGNDFSQPTVKIRNFKLYGQLYNSFYIIYINSNDNVGIETTKYASGNQDISYFKTSGTVVTTNQIRVTENGVYTVYVKDLAGNETISTIIIDKIYNQEENFDYTGSEQVFTVPVTGNYKLETWGAQGEENSGGYGGYSTGTIFLKKDNIVYINVGGKGSESSNSSISPGGYNGGGYGGITYSLHPQGGGGGGGATHIATTPGLLSTLENDKETILIVSGGGGGGNGTGGSGGGYIGQSGGYASDYPSYHGVGGTQSIGGFDYSTNSNYASFGQGSSINEEGYGGNGGGGGYYGGGGTNRGHSGAGGGSGYIGNSKLSDKVMYCYNCTESDNESTKTVSTTNVSETPIAGYAKIGNGYAKITFLGY